jgi:hypothetical protein
LRVALLQSDDRHGLSGLPLFFCYVKGCKEVAVRTSSVAIADVLAIIGVRIFHEVETIIESPSDKRELLTQPLIEGVVFVEWAGVETL